MIASSVSGINSITNNHENIICDRSGRYVVFSRFPKKTICGYKNSRAATGDMMVVALVVVY